MKNIKSVQLFRFVRLFIYESSATDIRDRYIYIGGKFLGTSLEKYFNRKTVKVSYSCMPNMDAIISGHNKKVKRKTDNEDETGPRTCNCRGGEQSCPMKGQCLQSSIIYKAAVKTTNKEIHYIGQAGNTFKERYNNHQSSMLVYIYIYIYICCQSIFGTSRTVASTTKSPGHKKDKLHPTIRQLNPANSAY